ncbi:hypothetical protein [Estrella lausannensis]|uniref:Uncharacterized protein n=1 Tax=Estrella lausannensis TaxID=483423 RepID=A0A0H5DNU6_9BACT|nr:hypothetical protein [Estrella lausannensis]CRX37513.1 Conserved hypothetical protein [Estrella lausannensis]
MNNIAENNQIRFVSIVKKKNGVFSKFKVNGIKGGTTFSASITVDLAAANVDLADPMEKIIEECAKIAAKDIKEPKYQFEGLQAI